MKSWATYLNPVFKTAFGISIAGMIGIVLDFGFEQGARDKLLLDFLFYIVIMAGVVSLAVRYIWKWTAIPVNARIFDITSFALTIFIVYLHLGHLQMHGIDDSPFLGIKFAVFLTFLREFSEQRVSYKNTLLNPAQLFIASFLIIIFLGAILLILPNATHEGISFLDALFTSTSAVCVTGLIVVDTGTYFTLSGQYIIMGLIQIGGLGILTFASYFSYFFKGGASYENQVVLSNITNSQKIGDVFRTLKYVLFITFTVESIAALLIYFSLDVALFQGTGDEIYFSVFHAISAYCNAGFSTLPNSLYEEGFRYNYFLHLVVIGTFVLGGLGFPIVVNILKFLKYQLLRIFPERAGSHNYKPWVLNLNSRITLVTTTLLTLVGFVGFFITEYNHTLVEHNGFGKVVTALFGATTPRTAGFNSVDMTGLQFSTLMMIFLLMWIGASPASTGGGIKTSTFAIATLNILSLAKGKSRIEVFNREISDISVRRAFSVISLSLIAIGTGILAIAITDPEKDLLGIAFECFSAYSTVGLSVGITAQLSDAGKLVITLLMFVGRISMLTLMIAIFNKVKLKNYRYPSEEILIN